MTAVSCSMEQSRLEVFHQYVRASSSHRTSYESGPPAWGASRTTPRTLGAPVPSIPEVQELFHLLYRARVLPRVA